MAERATLPEAQSSRIARRLGALLTAVVVVRVVLQCVRPACSRSASTSREVTSSQPIRYAALVRRWRWRSSLRAARDAGMLLYGAEKARVGRIKRSSAQARFVAHDPSSRLFRYSEAMSDDG